MSRTVDRAVEPTAPTTGPLHLADITALRSIPAAGVLLALTRRCPLSCAHCSTDSALDSEQHAEEPFRTLVDSFRPDSRPEVMVLSGGEALLRPRLVADLATTARRAGTRTCLMSGMYFARQGSEIPVGLRAALGAVDHFAASLDVHHEREVGRDDVFRMFRRVLETVPAGSFHVTGLGDGDPYVADLVADIRREFHDRVPVLVSRVQPTGRARPSSPPIRPPSPSTHSPSRPGPAPCSFAAWPLVDYDGVVYACSRQSLAASVRPAHLLLGHAASDPWDVLRERSLGSPLLRAIRLLGPVEVRRRLGQPTDQASGVCGTCATLSDDPELADAASAWLRPDLEAALRQTVEDRDPRRFAARWGSARYADLVNLGRNGASVKLGPDADPAQAAAVLGPDAALARPRTGPGSDEALANPDSPPGSAPEAARISRDTA